MLDGVNTEPESSVLEDGYGNFFAVVMSYWTSLLTSGTRG